MHLKHCAAKRRMVRDSFAQPLKFAFNARVHQSTNSTPSSFFQSRHLPELATQPQMRVYLPDDSGKAFIPAENVASEDISKHYRLEPINARV